MPNGTHRFLNNLSQIFMQNRLDAFAEHFVYPFPLYANDSLQVFGAECALKEAMKIYRDAALHAGIVKVEPRVLAEGLQVNRFSNVWVEWDHIDAEGKCVRTSQVHYVFYHADDALFPKVEMIEYTKLAFPDVPASFLTAKSA